MSSISIRDLVSEKYRTSKEYFRVRTTMEQNLARSEKIERYATHEAGHFLYLHRTKLIVAPEDAIFEGPTILDEEGEIGYFMAAVRSNRISLSDETLVYTEALLEDLADASVAGNVFELAKFEADEETKPSATGDFKTLSRHCYKAMTRNGLSYEAFSLWTKAHTRVTKNLLEASFSDAEIEVAKQVIRKFCFGLP